MLDTDKSLVLNTLHLSDERIEQILDQRDAAAAACNSSNHRRSRRRVFHRCDKMVITVLGSNGIPIRYAIAARNLSEIGIAFLHGAFLHRGTTCLLSLCDIEGNWVNVAGKVVRCCHLEGNVHEIGLRFVDTIDTQRFIKPQQQSDRSNLDLPKLLGRVLCVIDSYEQRREIRSQLAKLDVASVMTNRGSQAIALINGEVSYDVVIADQDLPDMSGIDLIAQLHEYGHDEPMMLLADPNTDMASDKQQVVIHRPVQLESLAAMLLQWLPRALSTCVE